jgi:hypothetical protein
MAGTLLAAMDSEPVYQVYGNNDDTWSDVDEEEMIRCRSIGEDTRTLYTAPLSVEGSEPVAYADPQSFDNFKSNGRGNAACTKEWMWRDPSDGLIPLYRHAQPAPVVPEEATPGNIQIIASIRPPHGVAFQLDKAECKLATDIWNACRGAMLQELQKSAGASNNCRSSENVQDLQAGNSPVIPDGYVMVPMTLTAENGAKGALSGEFSETKFVNCPECFGDDECETCDGSGRIKITVPVSWTTIKEIWTKGVDHFSAAPQEVKCE